MKEYPPKTVYSYSTLKSLLAFIFVFFPSQLLFFVVMFNRNVERLNLLLPVKNVRSLPTNHTVQSSPPTHSPQPSTFVVVYHNIIPFSNDYAVSFIFKC